MNTTTTRHALLALTLVPMLCALLLTPAHAQWQAVEAAAVAPLTPAEAAQWPDGVASGEPAPTRSLGRLLRLFQPKHDTTDEFALPVGNASHAASLRSRVADAVNEAAPTAFVREPDGRFVTLVGAARGADVAGALTDTITAALLQAGQTLRLAAAERWAAETKGLLRALHDPRALDEAHKLAARDSELIAVDAVRVVELAAQPASLWLSVKAGASRPRKLIATVNLDDVLLRVARRAP